MEDYKQSISAPYFVDPDQADRERLSGFATGWYAAEIASRVQFT
jgi:hypothetical protein